MIEIIPERRHVFVCPTCGSTDAVQTTAWIDANTCEVLDSEPPLTDDWCEVCGCHVRLECYMLAGAGPFARVVEVPDAG